MLERTRFWKKPDLGSDPACTLYYPVANYLTFLSLRFLKYGWQCHCLPARNCEKDNKSDSVWGTQKHYANCKFYFESNRSMRINKQKIF